MKPQLIAKRNAELRRKADADAAERMPDKGELQHSFGSDRGARAREITIATSQTVIGVCLILVGLLLMLPLLWLIPLLFAGGAGIFLLALIFAGLFIIALPIAGFGLIRLGISMLRGAAFNQRGAPALRALQKLSYDAVPLTAFTVGSGEVTNQVLISFDTDSSMRGILQRLAAELSDPETLEEMVGAKPFVPDRRRRLPRDLADGHLVYLADLQVRHVVMKGAIKKRLAVDCMVEPGAGGRIVVVN